MWAVITRSGRRCRTKTNMNMHELEGENQCSLFNVCMTETDAHTWQQMELECPFLTHLFPSVRPQLLPVAAPGGRRGLEDQTKLLGVTATRGKTTNIDFGCSLFS